MKTSLAIRFPRLLALLAALPLLAALLAPGRSLAQPPSTQSLEQAVSRLAQFQAEVDRMRGVVHQSFGPYTIGSECEVCSWSILGLCMQHHVEGWRRQIGLQGLAQIDQVLAQVQGDGVQLEQSYGPTRAWVDGLPAFSAAFGSAADIVLAVQQQIRQGQPATQQQRDQVTVALTRLQADLAHSASQLEAGVRTLAIALQKQSDYRNAIGRAIALSNEAAQQDLSQATMIASQQRCQDGVPQQLAAIRVAFANSSQQLAQAFSQLAMTSSGAEQSLGVLLGAVISSRTQMATVLNLVQAAGADQVGSFLEQLHLATAKKQWEDLAAAQGKAMLALAANTAPAR
jgi:hypothetical protein